MKVALCLSGIPRKIKECWPHLKKNFIDIYNPDVYSAFWIDKVEEDKKMRKDIETDKIIDAEEYKKLVNPTSFAFLNYNEATVSSFKSIDKIKFKDTDSKYMVAHRGIAACYLIELANNLKKTGESLFGKYDVVVRSRSDNVLYSVPDLNNLEPNTIYMPVYNCALGINDMFWYSDSETADKFTQPFSFIQGFDFRQIRVQSLYQEYFYKIIAQMRGITIKFTYDNQQIYHYTIKEGEKDKHIRDDLYLTKNGWVGHPGFRGMME